MLKNTIYNKDVTVINILESKHNFYKAEIIRDARKYAE